MVKDVFIELSNGMGRPGDGLGLLAGVRPRVAIVEIDQDAETHLPGPLRHGGNFVPTAMAAPRVLRRIHPNPESNRINAVAFHLYNLSIVEGMEGHVDAQETLLRDVVGIDPKHADALAGLGDLVLARGDPGAAAPLFEKTLTVSPTNLTALMGQGADPAASGDWQTAFDLYTRAIAVQPDYSFAYIDRARARRSLFDPDGAIQDLTQAIHLDPQYPWSYIDRGRIYLQQSHREEAVADFSMAIRLDPDQFETYALRAQALDAGGDAQGALADWDRVAALKPDYGYAYAPMAALAWQAGDWAAARDAFLKAYSFDDAQHSYLLCAALCAQKLGRQPDVAGIVEPVLSHAPADSWQRDIAHFLVDRSNESSLLARIDGERNAQVKAAMLFYVAVSYLSVGVDGAGLTYLTQIQGKGAPQAIETRLARAELDRHSAN